MDRLCYNVVYAVLLVDVEFLEALHLETVDIVVERDEIEGEVSEFEGVQVPSLLQVFLAHRGSFGPEHAVVLLVPFFLVLLVELDQGLHGFDVGGKDNQDIVEIVVDPGDLEVDNTALLGDIVLGIQFLLDDQVDRASHSDVEHQEFLPRNGVEQGYQLGLEVLFEESGLEDSLFSVLHGRVWGMDGDYILLI